MQTMQVYTDWLRSHNIDFQLIPVLGIVFKYQGFRFIICDNSNDELFLHLGMPNIYKVSDDKRSKVLEVINKMNVELKSLKATLQDDGTINLFTDTFIDQTPDIEDFFERLLLTLLNGRAVFLSQMPI